MRGPGTSAEDLVAYLALHGISADDREASRPSARSAANCCAPARELGADMMIMGAYGDSHERETIFGGNTQTIVDTATMPVLLNH